MASHRRQGGHARRSEAAALVSQHVALRRTSLAGVAPLVSPLTPDQPRAEADDNLVGFDKFVMSAPARMHFPHFGSSTVSAHRSTHTVAVSGVTAESLVLATLQSATSGVHVQAAVPASGGFTVHLSKKAPRPTTFAWVVLN